LRHLPTATNPTLVNGRPIKSRQVKAGDEIVIGLVVMELRTRTGATVGDSVPREATAGTRILEPDPVAAAAAAPEPTAVMAPPGEPAAEPTCVMSPASESEADDDPAATRIVEPEAAANGSTVSGRLMLTAGIDEWKGRRFELNSRRTGIGRSDDCDVALPVASVSRHHAALLWEGEELILVHESKVNPTYVNDVRVEGRTPLAHGDQIRLTDGVTFYLILDPPAHTEDYPTQPDLGPGQDQTLAEACSPVPAPSEPAGTVVMTGSAEAADTKRGEESSGQR
jgi:hypothetical protein